MKPTGFALLAAVAAVAATPLTAEEPRGLEAHMHGESLLQIAVDGADVTMTLLAPGMDIVGFEYAPTADADRAAVQQAVDTLAVPGNVVTLPAAAGCEPTGAQAALVTEDGGTGDSEESHDHAHGGDHAHDHGQAEADSGAHSAFRAVYAFACARPEDLTALAFPFFASFPNAGIVAVEYATAAGAGRVEVSGDAPEMTLPQ